MEKSPSKQLKIKIALDRVKIHQESAEGLEKEAQAGYLELSKACEELTALVSARSRKGPEIRLQAIWAAIKANNLSRAQELVNKFSADKKCTVRAQVYFRAASTLLFLSTSGLGKPSC